MIDNRKTRYRSVCEEPWIFCCLSLRMYVVCSTLVKCRSKEPLFSSSGAPTEVVEAMLYMPRQIWYKIPFAPTRPTLYCNMTVPRETLLMFAKAQLHDHTLVERGLCVPPEINNRKP